MAATWQTYDVARRKRELYELVFFLCENGKLTIGDKVDWRFKYSTDGVFSDEEANISALLANYGFALLAYVDGDEIVSST